MILFSRKRIINSFEILILFSRKRLLNSVEILIHISRKRLLNSVEILMLFSRKRLLNSVEILILIYRKRLIHCKISLMQWLVIIRYKDLKGTFYQFLMGQTPNRAYNPFKEKTLPRRQRFVLSCFRILGTPSPWPSRHCSPPCTQGYSTPNQTIIFTYSMQSITESPLRKRI